MQAIYAGQLDDLPEGARTAVAAPRSPAGAFATAALPVLEVDAPEAALDVLSRRGLVAGPTRDPSLGPSYVYRHALLRDAGYASLARAERAKLHLRLATGWLGSTRRPRSRLPRSSRGTTRLRSRRHPDLCGSSTGVRSREIRAAAADWFERATAVARAVAAWETAASLAARAVELTPDDARFERARRLLVHGEATASATGIGAALPLLREALAALRVAERRG